jgi:hypothetical protein
MTPAPSLEKRQGRAIAHYRDVAPQDTEAILGWQSPASRVRATSNSMLIHAER